MAGFNINDLLNIESITAKNSKINYTKLIPNEKNIYSLSDIEELANDIEDNGLLQNLVVKPNGDDIFKIIVGHRRWNAIKFLVEERGKKDFKSVSCLVLPENEDELLTELKLHTSNTTQRKLNDFETLQSIAELKRIYQALKDRGVSVKGKVSELIAESVNLKPTQVKKYMSISSNASEETMKELENQEITIENAYIKARSDSKKDKEGVSTTITQKPLESAKKSISKLTKDLGVLLDLELLDEKAYNKCIENLKKIENQISFK